MALRIFVPRCDLFACNGLVIWLAGVAFGWILEEHAPIVHFITSPTLLLPQANGGPLDHCWSVEWGSARHDMLLQKQLSRFGISIVGNNVANHLADGHLQRVG